MSVYHGPCRVIVTSVEALWPQRVAVRISDHIYAAVVPGTPGATCQIDEDRWELLLQHWVDGRWRTNLRALVGEWIVHGDVERQVIRSKDHDWPGDRDERNLVVTLERDIAADRVETQIRTAAASQPVATLSRLATEPNDTPLRAASAIRPPVSPAVRRGNAGRAERTSRNFGRPG